jgi:hypothetical protein
MSADSYRFMMIANTLFVKISLRLFHGLGSQKPMLFTLLRTQYNTLVLLFQTAETWIQE